MAKFIEKARNALFDRIDDEQEQNAAPKKSKKKSRALKEQPREDDGIVAFVKDKVEEVRGHASRIAHEGIWLTNIAYLLGFDSIFYDTNLRSFKPIHYPGQFLRRNRIHINKILPLMQNRLARLAKSPPRYDVKPNSSEQEDRDAARLGKQIILQGWDRERVNRKRLDLLMWVQQCGHAYLRVAWDPTMGRDLKVRSEEGEIELKREGDYRVDVASAFEVFTDPLAKSFEEITWLIHARIKPISYFRQTFKERGHLVKEEDAWLTSLRYEMRINTMNAQTGSATGLVNLLKDSAIELSYYEKPTGRHPNGRHIITAAGIKLKDDELPIDEIPFIKFDDLLVGGKYFSESVITHLRPIQDQYNRTVSQRASWVNRLLTGKYIAARGHGLMSSAINDQSGEVVEYDPVPGASEPKAMSIPTIPQYAYNEDDYLVQKMDDIAGINEVSRGQLPSASIPAIGMQFLVEQDDTRIGVITEQHEHSYANLGRIMLKYAERYYKNERLLKIAGSNMEYTVKEFRGEDLRGNLDVAVIRGSTLPGSKVLRRQEIINLHQSGYLGDPGDPKVLENVLNMLEYGEINEVWKDHSLDMKNINESIDLIESGEEVTVSEYDNHRLFVQEYNRYRKSDKFQALDEDQQDHMLKLMAEHVERLTDLMHPTTSESAMDNNPEFQERTGAQEMAAESEQQQQPPPPEEPMLEGEDLDELQRLLQEGEV
jgi:hypothetical protein